MNARSMVAQSKRLGSIAEFAFGEPSYVAIDMDCDFYVYMYEKSDPQISYEVYIRHPDLSLAAGKYKTQDWKDVVSLIDWLEDVEVAVPKKFRDR